MKKIYQIPATEYFETCVTQAALLMSSDPEDREATGSPTENGLTQGVGTTENTGDPYAEHGQGVGGGGNRAKEFFGDWELPEWE